jgi:hypothetical protein
MVLAKAANCFLPIRWLKPTAMKQVLKNYIREAQKLHKAKLMISIFIAVPFMGRNKKGKNLALA